MTRRAPAQIARAAFGFLQRFGYINHGVLESDARTFARAAAAAAKRRAADANDSASSDEASDGSNSDSDDDDGVP